MQHPRSSGGTPHRPACYHAIMPLRRIAVGHAGRDHEGWRRVWPHKGGPDSKNMMLQPAAGRPSPSLLSRHSFGCARWPWTCLRDSEGGRVGPAGRGAATSGAAGCSLLAHLGRWPLLGREGAVTISCRWTGRGQARCRNHPQRLDSIAARGDGGSLSCALRLAAAGGVSATPGREQVSASDQGAGHRRRCMDGAICIAEGHLPISSFHGL